MTLVGRLNEYQKAISTIGQILEPYDKDQLIPIIGFGGKPRGGTVSHCFPVTGAWPSEVRGVQGLMQAYSASFQQYLLSGPTLFSHVLKFVSDMAHRSTREESQYAQSYTVLLILTDGVINDMSQARANDSKLLCT